MNRLRLAVGRSVLAPRKPLSAPLDLEEGLILGMGITHALIGFPEKIDSNGRRICRTAVNMRWSLLSPLWTNAGKLLRRKRKSLRQSRWKPKINRWIPAYRSNAAPVDTLRDPTHSKAVSFEGWAARLWL